MNREIQQAKEYIASGEVEKGINLLFSKGYTKQALQESLNITKDTAYEDIVKQSLQRIDRLKISKLQGDISALDMEDEISKIARKVSSILTDMKADGMLDIKSNDSSENSEVLDVFLSYSTKDQDAKKYFVELFNKENIKFFLDEVSLRIGENIDDNLEEGLRTSRFTVFLVSENSLLSTWVSKETLFRLMQEEFHASTTLLPVLIDDRVFDDGFEFDIYDKLKEELDKQKKNRSRAEERNMNTKKYNIAIDRLERILPNITDIFHKLTEGLSANYFDESRRENDMKKLIETIKKDK